MALPRAVVYHSIAFDAANLLATWRPGGATSRTGDAVAKLESTFADYMGVESAIAFPFARTAVFFSLKQLNLEPGSEVVMPPITIKPMVDAVLSLDLRPVFVDIETETLCFDPVELEKAINPRTRAVLITYLFGIVPDVERLVAICRKAKLFIVEDYSHSLNSTFGERKLGTFGDVGIYSCSITKTLDAYGGGIAVTDDPELASALRLAARDLNHTPGGTLRRKVLKSLIWRVATDRLVWTLATFPMLRAIKRFNPVLEQKLTGARLNLQPSPKLPAECFQRFTAAQAKVGIGMLRKVEALDGKRIANVELIRSRLEDYVDLFPRVHAERRNVYWQLLMVAPDPAGVREHLAANGIDSGTSNLSLVCELGIYPEHERHCPNASYVKHHALIIPAHPTVSRRGIEKIARTLRDALASTSSPT